MHNSKFAPNIFANLYLPIINPIPALSIKETLLKSNITSFGSEGLEAASSDQFIFGKYNNPIATDLFQLGYGVAGNPKNVFAVSKTGNLIVTGDITDGAGNVLSEKQDILTYDFVQEYASNNLYEFDEDKLRDLKQVDKLSNMFEDQEGGMLDYYDLSEARNNRKKKKYEGQVAIYYIILYSLGRFFIEGLRTDSLMLGPLRMAQVISLECLLKILH